jgi:transcriptional regulator with XRE-family HTH domain
MDEEQAKSDDKVAKRIQAKRKKIELHQRNSEERAKVASDTKASYLANKDNPILVDILKKARAFSAYHTKMAKDGVGYRSTGAKLEDGTPEQELFYYTSEKRVSEMDKSAGIDELIDYIERQLVEAPSAPAEVAEAQ